MLQIHRVSQVAVALGLSKSTVWLRVKQGQCTPPIRLGDRAVGWPVNEVEAINAARIAGKSNSEIEALVKKLVADRALAA